MTPIRIQRKRTKGWKMPDNTIYVGRPGKWGNPFIGGNSVELFRECLLNSVMVYTEIDEIEATVQFNRFKWMAENLHTLKGKNLACFCPLDSECHADVLLKYADQNTDNTK